MPTQDCNCSCTYCYIPNHERTQTSNEDFLLSLVNEFINNLDKKGYDGDPEIRFVGGEPYLAFSSIVKIASLFLNRIANGKIIINTNGTLFSTVALSSFKRNFRNRIIHIISLDGIEEIHNKRRISKKGLNLFQEAVKGIRLLKSFNMPVYLNMVLDELTVSRLDDFMRFIKRELNIHELSVSLLYDSKLPLSQKMKLRLITEAYRLAGINNILISGHHRLLLGLINEEFRCKAGAHTAVISSDRKIYACQRFVGRTKAKEYTLTTDFNSISCDSCVDTICYSDENRLLGEQIYSLYTEDLRQYRYVNSLDRLLFGVISND